MTAHHRLTAALCPRTAPSARKGLLHLAASAALACGLLLAPAPSLAVSDDAVLRRMDAVLEENTRLRDEAWKARKHGREAARQAEEAANASDERLERTRTEALAHVAGVSPAQVETLRKDGKSWGQAAGELGVHPGFLGVGKAPLYQSLPPQKPAKAIKGKNAKKSKSQLKSAKGKKGEAKLAPAKKSAKKAAKVAPKAKSSKKSKKSQ